MDAREFAQKAHEGQKRKYTGEPYFTHCEEVARLVEGAGGTPEMVAAAYLHDVLEDTPTKASELIATFGVEIAAMVWYLTDRSEGQGNRAERAAFERGRYCIAPPPVQTIKIADLISNTLTIVKYDPGFAKVYLREKRLLLGVLTRGEWGLRELALEQCGDTAEDTAKTDEASSLDEK